MAVWCVLLGVYVNLVTKETVSPAWSLTPVLHLTEVAAV